MSRQLLFRDFGLSPFRDPPRRKPNLLTGLVAKLSDWTIGRGVSFVLAWMVPMNRGRHISLQT